LLKHIKDPKDLRPTMLSLMSTSGTLAGLSLALTSIVNLRISQTNLGSLADDMFLFSSLGFLIVCFFTFFGLRHLHSERMIRWTGAIDYIFLGSLLLLVLAGFVTVYEIM
jgi:hypothetical protein